MKIKLKTKLQARKLVAVQIDDNLFMARAGGVPGHVKIANGAVSTMTSANPVAQIGYIAKRPGAICIYEGDTIKVTF